jgi:UDP-N-acetylmuramoyl-tripeptide--D-alanyl-D-alanine ligase
MIALTAAEVAGAVGGELHGSPDVLADGPVVVDSRKAQAGSIFVVVPGENSDGLEYVPEAEKAGATLIISAQPVDAKNVVMVPNTQIAIGELAKYVLAKIREHNPALKIAAITGSQGKTTTKDLLAQLLSGDPTGDGATSGVPVVAPVGSFNNEIGLPLTVLRISPSTRYAVLEMGADRVGNIADLTTIAPPEIGVVLTVGTAHIETFGSKQGIANAKSEMVAGVIPGGVAVLNLDDPLVSAMRVKADARGLRSVMFGTCESADVRATDVTVDELGRASYTLTVDPSLVNDDASRSYPVTLQIIGEHHVSNSLAAAAAAILAGVEPATVAQRLSVARPLSPHRMAVRTRSDDATIIDDAYNANPESMRAALATLRRVASDRRAIAILGTMRELGETGEDAHAEMGRLAAELGIDELIVIGEGAHSIFESANSVSEWKGRATFLPDIKAGFEFASSLLLPGDVVLVKASNGSKLWQLADWLTSESVASEVAQP